MPPTVDILLPFRDAAATLPQAWASLASQTVRSWRLVAVDDGSTDGGGDLLRSLMGRESAHRVVQGPGRGVAAALNAGLAAIESPWVLRMDADDLSHPRRLELLLQATARPGPHQIVASRVRPFPRGAVSPNMARYYNWQNALTSHDAMRRERYVECTLAHASALFRARLLRSAGGWSEDPIPEDLDLFLRLFRLGAPFLKLPDVLYFIREHPRRHTRTSPLFSPSAFHECRLRHLADELRHRGAVSVDLLGRPGSLSPWGEGLRSEGFAVHSVSWKPGNPLPPRRGDFLLACFGVPSVRHQVRSVLSPPLREEEDFLFVG